MCDWLTIQRYKKIYPSLKTFVQDNPALDMIMRTLLAKYLNLSGPSVRKWIEDYQQGIGRCECMQMHVDHYESATLQELKYSI